MYVEAPQTPKEVELLVKRTPAPIALNLIPGGKTPPFLMRELEQLGVRQTINTDGLPLSRRKGHDESVEDTE